MVPGRILHIEDSPFVHPYGKAHLDAFLTGLELAKFTIKFDGCPAVFVGLDPSDLQVFVSSKRFLNVKRVIYKTPNEINDSNLSIKMKAILIKLLEIYQEHSYVLDHDDDRVVCGDILYAFWSLRTFKYDWSFQPNVIEYRMFRSGQQGLQVGKSTFGVAWHTEYDFCTRTPRFAQTDQWNPKGIWSPENAPEWCDTEEVLPQIMDVLNYKKYEYTEERGRLVKRALNRAAELGQDFNMEFYRSQNYPIVDGIEYAVEYAETIIRLKNAIMNNINTSQQLHTFLRYENETVPTTHEGFVGSSKFGTYKFVNRKVFTHLNITDKYEKGWL